MAVAAAKHGIQEVSVRDDARCLKAKGAGVMTHPRVGVHEILPVGLKQEQGVDMGANGVET